jgi:chromosome segregation ATPase
LRQLEARVRDQLQTQRKQKQNITNETNKQTLIKLERDFDRVQVIATNCKSKVARQQKQLQQRGAAAASALSDQKQTPNSAAESLQQEQERFQLQVQQDHLTQEIMQERELEIRNINKGMHQVNEIYKDLAHIVGSQQEHVDQIETQMDNAKGNAESGLSQVQKANDKYNQSQCTIS